MLNKKLKYNKLSSVKTDVFLIGAGVMSATLGVLLKKIYPNLKITISERLFDSAL